MPTMHEYRANKSELSIRQYPIILLFLQLAAHFQKDPKSLPYAKEMLVRKGTNGETWVQHVLDGLISTLTEIARMR